VDIVVPFKSKTCPPPASVATRPNKPPFRVADEPVAYRTIDGWPIHWRDHYGTISERTKAALAAKKTGGARLGNPSNISRAEEIGWTVQTTTADEFVAGLLPIIQAIRGTGATTLRDMTAALNQRGIRSARGGRWHVSSVMNLLARASAVPSTAALS
jgi:hypothetical protein